MKTVHIRAFGPDESLLLSEASSLGFAVGEVPDKVLVTNGAGSEARFELERVLSEGWELKRTFSAQPSGLGSWVPSRMVILND